MRKIKLTRDQVALVDNENFEYLNQFKWYASKKSSGYYAHRVENTSTGKRYIKMHREIMDPSENMQIHHINHNTLDNRKSNLKIVTGRENHQNRKNHGLWPLGVHWHKSKNRFQSDIRINKKKKHLGDFIDHISGSIIYNIVLEELQLVGVE